MGFAVFSGESLFHVRREVFRDLKIIRPAPRLMSAELL
jgi:hypothetical protein